VLYQTNRCDQQLCTIYLLTVYATLSVSCNTAYETAAYIEKRLPTRPFLAECFCILMSLYHVVFINELFSFLFQLSFDVFRSVATETGDPIDTTQQAARMADAHTAPASVAHVGTSRRRCLPPPHSACRLSTTNEALPRCSCRNRRAGSGCSGDAAEFHGWSLVLTDLQSYILLISLLSAWLPVITCRSVNYAIC